MMMSHKGEKMNELVTKQAVIDVIDNFNVFQSKEDQIALERKIVELPSAEPQIIRCKDCKHWIPYDWMFSEMWQSKNIADYHEDDIGCDCCEMAMKANDFCSRAERREVTT